MPDDEEAARVAVGPPVGDVRRAVGADAVEAPLGQAELAVESVDQVQARGRPSPW